MSCSTKHPVLDEISGDVPHQPIRVCVAQRRAVALTVSRGGTAIHFRDASDETHFEQISIAPMIGGAMID